MRDAECVELLRWALPRLRLRWPGFRRVRRQVCRRVGRRLRELGLPDAPAYRAHLEAHPAEWERLDALCRISISRFFRDRSVFAALGARVLPVLAARARAQGRDELRAWSAGCASGEEAYSLAILWGASAPAGARLRIVATDADPQLLGRARRARYPASSLAELPPGQREAAFERRGALYGLRAPLREGVELRCQDVRREAPEGSFDLVLCRNLAFTYFEPALQAEVLARILAALRPGGALVIGLHESLPESAPGLAPWPGARAVYEKRPS
jgi:chemotaxis protein methyltransferase CheR